MIPRFLPPVLFVIDAIAVYAQPAVREIRMSEIDATAIVIAVIAAAPPSFIAYLAYRTSIDAKGKIERNAAHLGEVELKIDGRLTQLLESTAVAQRAQGVVEGRGEQAQIQVQAAMQPPSEEPMQVVVVPDANALLPVTVVDQDKKP